MSGAAHRAAARARSAAESMRERGEKPTPRQRALSANLGGTTLPSLRGDVDGFDKMQEKTELAHVLDSFSRDGTAWHRKKVDHRLERLKREAGASLPGGDAADSELLKDGCPVRIQNLTEGSVYNGRDGVVIGLDGRDRYIVQVVGASELCQLSLKRKEIEVQQVSAPEEEDDFGDSHGGRAERDFSAIHQLAEQHARENARKEVDLMFAEGAERKKKMEQSLRAQSMVGGSGAQRSDIPDFSAVRRERCRYGAGCNKQACIGLHPWDADWVSGANSGCDTKKQYKVSESIYAAFTPAPQMVRVAARNRTATSPRRTQRRTARGGNQRGGGATAARAPSTDPTEEAAAQAARDIDRILSRAGLPSAVRELAHETIIPLLCSNRRGAPSPASTPGGGFGAPLLLGDTSGAGAGGAGAQGDREVGEAARLAADPADDRRVMLPPSLPSSLPPPPPPPPSLHHRAMRVRP